MTTFKKLLAARDEQAAILREMDKVTGPRVLHYAARYHDACLRVRRLERLLREEKEEIEKGRQT